MRVTENDRQLNNMSKRDLDRIDRKERQDAFDVLFRCRAEVALVDCTAKNNITSPKWLQHLCRVT